jgi:hypothetical protein
MSRAIIPRSREYYYKYVTNYIKRIQSTLSTYNSLLKCIIIEYTESSMKGARGSVAGWNMMLHAGRSRARFPMSLDFFRLT